MHSGSRFDFFNGGLTRACLSDCGSTHVSSVGWCVSAGHKYVRAMLGRGSMRSAWAVWLCRVAGHGLMQALAAAGLEDRRGCWLC